MPTMISNESANTMTWGESILYCDNLNESGYSDWIMPSIDQLTYAISGGCTFTDNRSEEYIWTRTPSTSTSPGIVHILSLLDRTTSGGYQLNRAYTSTTQFTKCRCVR